MSKATATLLSKEVKSFKTESATGCGEQNAPAARSLEARVDGRRVVIHAADEILLECGASSILLRKDGKIILKGIQIVSRASECHKIRGASVQIN